MGPTIKVFYLYECPSGHRVCRYTQTNPAPCSICGGFLAGLASVARRKRETEDAHRLRTLRYKPKTKRAAKFSYSRALLKMRGGASAIGPTELRGPKSN
jgi:hypothetical protein